MSGWDYTTGILVVLLLLTLWRLRAVSRQLRCARYCYLDMSDWAIHTVKETKDVALWLVDDDPDRLPDFIGKDSPEGWNEKSKQHQGMFKRAGMRWLDESEFGYVIENLSRK